MQTPTQKLNKVFERMTKSGNGLASLLYSCEGQQPMTQHRLPFAFAYLKCICTDHSTHYPTGSVWVLLCSEPKEIPETIHFVIW